MKKGILFLLFSILGIFLYGCSSSNDDGYEVKVEDKSITQSFLEQGNGVWYRYVYKDDVSCEIRFRNGKFEYEPTLFPTYTEYVYTIDAKDIISVNYDGKMRKFKVSAQSFNGEDELSFEQISGDELPNLLKGTYYRRAEPIMIK